MEVVPSASKTWRNGKRERVTIGAYPAFTIKQARDRMRNCAHWSSAAGARPKPSVRNRRNRRPLTRAA